MIMKKMYYVLGESEISGRFYDRKRCMLPESFYFRSIYSYDMLCYAKEVKFGYRVTFTDNDKEKETYYLTNKFHDLLLDGSFIIEK